MRGGRSLEDPPAPLSAFSPQEDAWEREVDCPPASAQAKNAKEGFGKGRDDVARYYIFV